MVLTGKGHLDIQKKWDSDPDTHNSTLIDFDTNLGCTTGLNEVAPL